MLEWVTMCSIGGIMYAYFGYPLLLVLLLRRPRTQRSRALGPPIRRLSVVIAAHNEAPSILDKLENCQIGAQVAIAEGIDVEIIVASDASDDGTDDLAAAVPGVRVVRTLERGGKERAQIAAIAVGIGEIFVFTDVKVRFQPDALTSFARYFSDPTVGAVSSVDHVTTARSEGSGEGFYVRYEMWLRRLESEVCSLIGLSGSCFAARREIVERIRPDLPSDFVTMIETQRAGLRGVLAEDIPCTYQSVASETEEYERKVRTVLRGITALMSFREMLNPFRYGLFAIELLSHKLLRWLVPWCFLLSGLGSFSLMFRSPFFLTVFLGHIFLILFAAVALKSEWVRASLPGKVALFFVLSNAAIFTAWWRYLVGNRAVIWTPSEKRV